MLKKTPQKTPIKTPRRKVEDEFQEVDHTEAVQKIIQEIEENPPIKEFHLRHLENNAKNLVRKLVERQCQCFSFSQPEFWKKQDEYTVPV